MLSFSAADFACRLSLNRAGEITLVTAVSYVRNRAHLIDRFAAS
jgi:hypothetical protein